VSPSPHQAAPQTAQLLSTKGLFFLKWSIFANVIAVK